MKILVLNAGSSSQKSCLYEIQPHTDLSTPLEPLWEASIDWTVSDEYGLLKVFANGQKRKIDLPLDNKRDGILIMLETITHGHTKVLSSLDDIDIIGHRIVHGGRSYSRSCIITPEVEQTIKDLIPLAPNHHPAHLEGIKAIALTLPQTPQVAVFDTAFHSSIPPKAKIYPLPYQWYERGIQRYGFHGISHGYVSQRAAQILGKPMEDLKIISCHLGNGSSVTAIKNGHSIDTSMGFTPLEGLMMGTRCGSIDPAILLHLMDEYGYDYGQLNQLLNKESGLLGVSQISADVRSIISAIANGNHQAQLALDIFTHRVTSVIGSMIPGLGGLDVLIFTAGIGENSPLIREQVCSQFSFLNLKLDREKNQGKCLDRNIANPDSSVAIITIKTQEDWAIALQTLPFCPKES
ncbi:acetate kinase [Cyanobacterium stanieri LEGE 03274]|uniref:Acetate kinase n=1 Tax=Cyanobacterium stanieri LEGE 03274 TaxID=1828756 RepID=A0ABR9V4T1_9CHRO|nr:acetate kinase [Cyanobacterium stanieri]MBE9222888.1 acetate kinase [Cyanobacterium stanieri LEGE 03274]